MAKHKRRKAQKVILAFFLLSILAMVFFQIKRSNRLEKMRQNASWTTGHIIDYSGHPQAGGGSIIYKFIVEGDNYEGETGFGHLFGHQGESLINKFFPVMYDSTDIESNEIILYKGQSEDYRFEYPDSFKTYELLED